jgi:hypothetical protein
MTIYLLRPKSNIYHSLVPLNEEDWEVFDSFVGDPLAEHWTPVRVVFEDGEAAGDFPSLLRHVPVFSDRALKVLLPLIKTSVEILPLDLVGETEKLYAVNVLNLLDALDYEKSKITRFPSGGVMFIDEYAFREDVISDSDIFKIAEAPLKSVLVSERFKALTEKNGLLGLAFKKVG